MVFLIIIGQGCGLMQTKIDKEVNELFSRTVDSCMEKKEADFKECTIDAIAQIKAWGYRREGKHWIKVGGSKKSYSTPKGTRGSDERKDPYKAYNNNSSTG